DRHHAARKVERDLVQLLVPFHVGAPVEVFAIEDRDVQQVLQTRLKVTDQITVEEDFLGFPSGDVTVPLQNYPVLGERAGLIRAENVHAAEILNRIQAFDDHLFAAHRQRALGE